MPKTVYQYDKTTHFFTASLELDESDKSPSGQYQIPAFCTEVAPEESKGGYSQRWTGSAWECVDTADVIVYGNNGLSQRTEEYSYTVQQGEAILPAGADEAALRAAFSGYDAAIKAKKLQDLETEYNSGVSDITSALQLAQLRGDTNQATSLKSDFEALQAGYEAAKKELEA